MPARPSEILTRILEDIERWDRETGSAPEDGTPLRDEHDDDPALFLEAITQRLAALLTAIGETDLTVDLALRSYTAFNVHRSVRTGFAVDWDGCSGTVGLTMPPEVAVRLAALLDWVCAGNTTLDPATLAPYRADPATHRASLADALRKAAARIDRWRAERETDGAQL
jgi:hypothetical protein